MDALHNFLERTVCNFLVQKDLLQHSARSVSAERQNLSWNLECRKAFCVYALIRH